MKVYKDMFSLVLEIKNQTSKMHNSLICFDPQSNYISRCKFSFYFAQKKLLFLFYTLIFPKHPHQFIYSTHLFNKIFIIFPFFIILSLTETHLPQNNSLSLTDQNHHHTNHQILASTKHLFIMLFITSFITSSLQWVSKVDPPLLRL